MSVPVQQDGSDQAVTLRCYVEGRIFRPGDPIPVLDHIGDLDSHAFAADLNPSATGEPGEIMRRLSQVLSLPDGNRVGRPDPGVLRFQVGSSSRPRRHAIENMDHGLLTYPQALVTAGLSSWLSGYTEASGLSLSQEDLIGVALRHGRVGEIPVLVSLGVMPSPHVLGDLLLAMGDATNGVTGSEWRAGMQALADLGWDPWAGKDMKVWWRSLSREFPFAKNAPSGFPSRHLLFMPDPPCRPLGARPGDLQALQDHVSGGVASRVPCPGSLEEAPSVQSLPMMRSVRGLEVWRSMSSDLLFQALTASPPRVRAFLDLFPPPAWVAKKYGYMGPALAFQILCREHVPINFRERDTIIELAMSDRLSNGQIRVPWLPEIDLDDPPDGHSGLSVIRTLSDLGMAPLALSDLLTCLLTSPDLLECVPERVASMDGVFRLLVREQDQDSLSLFMDDLHFIRHDPAVAPCLMSRILGYASSDDARDCVASLEPQVEAMLDRWLGNCLTRGVGIRQGSDHVVHPLSHGGDRGALPSPEGIGTLSGGSRVPAAQVRPR